MLGGSLTCSYMTAARMKLACIDFRNSTAIHIKVSGNPTLYFAVCNHSVDCNGFFK